MMQWQSMLASVDKRPKNVVMAKDERPKYPSMYDEPTISPFISDIKFYDVYKRPFITDGYFIYAQNDYDIMALDCPDEMNEDLIREICAVINGGTGHHIGVKSVKNEIITLDNGNELRVRGWGYLTSHNIPSRVAAQMQDDFAKWVAEQLINDSK